MAPKSLHLMPGPTGLRKIPYIGTAMLFQPFSKFPLEAFGQMTNAMHEKYGSIFKTRLGRDYSVFIDSVEDIETVFRSESPYPERRLMTLSKVYRERNGLPPALGTVSGPQWYELRSPLNPLLNKPQVCLHYLPAQNQVADDFVGRLEDRIFSAEELSEEFFKFAAESIGVVCFNQRMGFLDNEDRKINSKRSKLLSAFKTTLNCTFIAMVGLERKYLKTENDPFYKEYSDAMKFIRKQSSQYVERIVGEMNSSSHHDKAGDLSSHKIRDSNLLASMIRESGLDMEKILAIIDSMLIAGTDSTARNLAVLFYNFAKFPETQEKVAREILGVLGPSGNITPNSLSNIPYLKACVKESMRINFPLANGTERILTSDVVLGEYLVPRGTSVILSSNRASLNPSYFADPFTFAPERWMRGGNSNWGKPPAYACLPFGHGARGCIGRRFAEMEIYVGAAKMLQRLKIDVDPSYSGLDPIYTPFITPRQPIPFVFTKRFQ